MTKTIDWTKPIQRRDGGKAVLLSLDHHDVWLAYQLPAGIEPKWRTSLYMTSGKALGTSYKSGADIINVPVVREGWVIFSPAMLYETEDEVLAALKQEPVGYFSSKVTWEE